MSPLRSRVHPARSAVLAVAVGSALALASCAEGATSGSEEDVDVRDLQQADEVQDVDTGPYDGVYDREFSADVYAYEDETVTVSADVAEVLSPTSLVLAGTEDTEVEPLLVVGATEVGDLSEGQAVEVTGTAHGSFDVAEAEALLGVDLDDPLYEDHVGLPYLEAAEVQPAAPEG